LHCATPAEGHILIDGGNRSSATPTGSTTASTDSILVHGRGGEEGDSAAPPSPGGRGGVGAAADSSHRGQGRGWRAGVAYGAALGTVKMVHNGIEYGDMQLIAETYDLLHRGAGMPPAELADVFEEWNRGDLKSYLIEITAAILRKTDADTGRPMVDVILDEAQQKGTGKWMSQNAFDVGAPIPTVNAAVESRMLSALKRERVAASQVLVGPTPSWSGDRRRLIEAARQALYASKVTSYAQGMALLRLASAEYGYDIDPGLVARIWRAGCIVRAALLGDIREAFRRDPGLGNLMLDPTFRDAMASRQDGWRHVVQTAVGIGIPVPGIGVSLAYYDGYRSARLPANLTQAQRDFFGAHTYRRTDRDGVFHTEWE
jgi:6-phosphogluconate dehydrogenase